MCSTLLCDLFEMHLWFKHSELSFEIPSFRRKAVSVLTPQPSISQGAIDRAIVPHLPFHGWI